MKKLLISLIALLILVGCGGSGNTADRETLKIFNIGEYIDESVLDDFEREYNVDVIYDTYASNEELYTKYATGTLSYDILVPSDYMIERFNEEGLLQEIDLSKVPNVANLMESTKNKAYDPEMKISVPYFWGDLGIVYNKAEIDPSVVESKGWNILQDEAYKGKVYMYDSVRDAFAPALKALGFSLNSTDENEINEAAEWLRTVNTNVEPVYAGDEVIDQMIAGQKDIAIMYSGDAAYVMTENEDLAYYVPKEGSNVWQDAMVIPANAENVEMAHKFMDFVLREDIARRNTEYVGYRTVVQSVYDEMIGEGGMFEGNNAYMENENPKHEEFFYTPEVKDLLDELWTTIKVVH